MLRELGAWLERPGQPLLGPNLRGLGAVGLWPPGLSPPVARAHDALSAACFVFVGTQFAGLPELWPDLALVMDNLSLATVSLMAVAKLISFRVHRDAWHRLVFAIGEIESSQLRSEEAAREIAKYVRYSRVITYGFWVVCICTISLVNFDPLTRYMSSKEYRECLHNGSLPYPRVFKSWFPVDVSRPPAYGVALAVEVILGYYGTIAMAVWDTLVVAVMVFFAGQFRLLRAECERVFGSDAAMVSDEMAHHRIVACYHHHLFLLKWSKLFNAMVSPVMFVYFIVCSFMLCAIAVQITSSEMKLMKMAWTVEYLVAVLTELFLFYWHSNEVLVHSGETERGAWCSVWYERRRGVGARELALLATGLRCHVVFSAGPFHHMTLATFLAILKVSYSYFTLLRTTEH